LEWEDRYFQEIIQNENIKYLEWEDRYFQEIIQNENIKYLEWEDRYLKEIRSGIMTCIIGAVCRDGVVLVGDRRIIRGSEILSKDKIRPIQTYPNTVVALSGTAILMDYFISDVNDIPSRVHGVMGDKEILKSIENVNASLYDRYYQRIITAREIYDLDVLLCYKVQDNQPPKLLNINITGVGQMVNTFYIIGHGRPYVTPFIKTKYCNKPDTITMNEIATVGVFAIKLIEKQSIDWSVGGNPQIWKLPNNMASYEVLGDELDKINDNAKSLLSNFEKIM
jgi:20S proteasome alpha/beta subunit